MKDLYVNNFLKIHYKSQISDSNNVVIKSNKSYDEYEFEDEYYIFDPKDTGAYTITYNGKNIDINVFDLDDINLSDFSLSIDKSYDNGYAKMENGLIKLRSEQNGSSHNHNYATAKQTVDLKNANILSIDWDLDVKTINYQYGELSGRVYVRVGGDVLYGVTADNSLVKSETRDIDVSGYTGMEEVSIEAYSLASTSLGTTGNHSDIIIRNVTLSD